MTGDADELRDIPGFPGYSVTRDGRVKGPSGKWLKPHVHSRHGYLALTLRINRRDRTLYLHRAVLLAWVGPCPSGMESCHGDGNSANNHVDNLRWDTHAANMVDRARHMESIGRDYFTRGEANGSTQLSENDIHDIRSLLNAKLLSMKSIAEHFGVNEGTIRAIKTGRSWGWLA